MKEVIYTCQECGSTFEAHQGSRSRYCNTCLIKKLLDRHYKQGKCTLCGKEGNVVDHHQTYDMFINKKKAQAMKKGDIIRVCLSCHMKIHKRAPYNNQT